MRFAALISLLTIAIGATACGDDPQRQDADEPAADYEVKVTTAKFPTEQRLAQTSDLRIAVENTGDEAIPNLAVTISTGDENASGPFSVISDQPGLADPNRPVWILENGFPKCISAEKVPPCIPPGEDENGGLDQAGSAGAEAVETNTFAFGSLEPGGELEGVWQVTPVEAGTYTVRYEIAAGLTGKARALTADGGPVEGQFVVTISDKTPRVRVNDAGEVVIRGD